MQARAILECLELAAAESQRRAHPPVPLSAFQNFSVSAFSSASDLRIDLIELKTSLIKWMFFFAVTQTLATALILKLHIS